MPATNPQTMLLIDLPLCVGTTGSLVAFYALAESAQGRRRRDALRVMPALLALGAGLAPHLSKAVLEGLRSMAGEFVRTPKRGVRVGRYRATSDLPMIEILLFVVSLASTVASIQTHHWFATPFAAMFTFGYGYVAFFVAREQLATRMPTVALPAAPSAESGASAFSPLAHLQDGSVRAVRAALETAAGAAHLRLGEIDPRPSAPASAAELLV
jgi:hypothetical protein